MNDPVAINNTAFQDGQTNGPGGIQEDLRRLNVEALKLCADHLGCLFFLSLLGYPKASRIFNLFEPHRQIWVRSIY